MGTLGNPSPLSHTYLNMRFSRVVVPACALGLACLALPAHAQRRGAVNEYGNPSRLAPAPTTSAISVRDLQVRLYQFADDSMQGRQVGRAGNMKGTAYIAAELQRLGLVPAGDNGTFFQVLPYHLRSFTAHSRLTVSGNPLRWEADWLAIPGARAPRPVSDAEVVFGGVAGDTTRQIAPRDAAGKFVVLLPERRLLLRRAAASPRLHRRASPGRSPWPRWISMRSLPRSAVP